MITSELCNRRHSQMQNKTITSIEQEGAPELSLLVVTVFCSGSVRPGRHEEDL